MSALRFLLLAGVIAFLSTILLVAYESVKAGGYKRTNERTILWFSVVVGIIAAAVAFGWMPMRGPFGY